MSTLDASMYTLTILYDSNQPITARDRQYKLLKTHSSGITSTFLTSLSVMSATGEVESSAVEKLPEEAPAADQPPVPAEKPVKEKKARTRKTVPHPPYFQMIEEALVALNEKSGSSPYAIAKSVEEKHRAVLPPNFKKMLGLQLKKAAAKGKLVKIKASYKLSEPAKKSRGGGGGAKAEKKSEGKAATRRKTEEEEEKKKKKVVVVGKKRKWVAAIAKPKQPKSIKAPAKKKAKKGSATA